MAIGKKIKWYGYCHFDSSNSETSIDSISCGKCSKEFDDSTQVRTDQANLKLSFKYQTNRFPNEYYCSFYEKNTFSKREHFVDSHEESVPLLPYLDADWLTEHLGFLIERNEIATNLNSSISLNDLIDHLKIIEIINFGIETIDSKAFSKFKNLKILRLPNNDLTGFNFASFTQEHTNEPEISSNLIELDLSSNKLSKIKIENFMYLNNLRVLNLSCNFISMFDLQLINVISPHLQVLDLSENYLKKFKLIENSFYFSSKNKNLSTISLISNLILNEIMYLDLSKNLLTDLSYLFSINLSSFNDTKYCNLSFKSKLKLVRKQRPIIYVNLDNNNWLCDCLSYEFVTSLQNLPSPIQSNSCYLNFLINENSNLFKNFKIDKLNCSSKCTSSKISNKDAFNSTTTSETTLQTSTITTTYTTTSLSKIFRSSRIPFSYDISSTFYWICSICIGIVSISCLLVAWYFCWKKYRMNQIDGEQNFDTSSINSRMHPDTSNQRRNLYFLTNRLNSQFPMNNNWRNRPIVDPSLFFISLNQNNGISDTVFNNIAYINDDPPNYYEAIMIKNRISSINQREADSLNLNDFLPIDTPSIEFIGENLTDIPEESEGTNLSFRQSTEV